MSEARACDKRPFRDLQETVSLKLILNTEEPQGQNRGPRQERASNGSEVGGVSAPSAACARGRAWACVPGHATRMCACELAACARATAQNTGRARAMTPVGHRGQDMEVPRSGARPVSTWKQTPRPERGGTHPCPRARPRPGAWGGRGSPLVSEDGAAALRPSQAARRLFCSAGDKCRLRDTLLGGHSCLPAGTPRGRAPGTGSETPGARVRVAGRGRVRSGAGVRAAAANTARPSCGLRGTLRAGRGRVCHGHRWTSRQARGLGGGFAVPSSAWTAAGTSGRRRGGWR